MPNNPFDPDSYAYARREEAFDELCSSDEVVALTKAAQALFQHEAAKLKALQSVRYELGEQLYIIAVREWMAGIDALDENEVGLIRLRIANILDVFDVDVSYHIHDFPTAEKFLSGSEIPVQLVKR